MNHSFCRIKLFKQPLLTNFGIWKSWKLDLIVTFKISWQFVLRGFHTYCSFGSFLDWVICSFPVFVCSEFKRKVNFWHTYLYTQLTCSTILLFTSHVVFVVHCLINLLKKLLFIERISIIKLIFIIYKFLFLFCTNFMLFFCFVFNFMFFLQKKKIPQQKL